MGLNIEIKVVDRKWGPVPSAPQAPVGGRRGVLAPRKCRGVWGGAAPPQASAQGPNICYFGPRISSTPGSMPNLWIDAEEQRDP